MPKKNSTIPIYKSEREAGLAKAIQTNASISYITQLQDTKLSQDVVREFLTSVAGENESSNDQFDLFYLNTILVTTGWNKNDDVFPADETWMARYSPIHKQFNLEHDQSKIIGHMTTAKAVNESFELIDDDTSIDELPSKFHILTGAVIYKALADPTAQENIDKIIEEIEAGEWYVSMECLFRGFDYALTAASGEQKFLARSEQTAFLTKHLRVYGGTGKFEDFTLGRALKNITFSGKGLVRKPANPESIIFNEAVTNFNASYASLGYITSSDNLIQTKGSNNMANENENSDKVTKLESKLAELTEANKVLADQVKTHESSATTAKITSLEADKALSAEKVNVLETELKAVKDQNIEMTTKLGEAEARAIKAEALVAESKAVELVRARTAMLIEKNFTPEKAAELVRVFADKNDTDFSAIANLFAPTVVVKSEIEETVPKVGETDVETKSVGNVIPNDQNNDVEATRAKMAAMSAVFGEMIKVA